MICRRFGFFKVSVPVLGVLLWSGLAGATSLGVFRWDGWNPSAGLSAWADDLAPSQFHDCSDPSNYRLPWFAVDNGLTVTIDGNRQGVVDAELQAAYDGHIDYFIYGYYADAPAYNYALNLHLSSPNRTFVKMAFWLQGWTHSGNDQNDFEQNVAPTLVNVMKDTAIYMYSGGRPIVFFYDNWIDSLPFDRNTELAWFRSYIQSQTGADPFFVGLQRYNDGSLFDGYSNYADKGVTGDIHNQYPYLSLAQVDAREWPSNTIPLITMNWDPYPRYLGNCPVYCGSNGYAAVMKGYTPPQPSELGQQVANAINWAQAHPRGADTVIMYSWNEYDEGGLGPGPSLCEGAPTPGNPGPRLQAIAAAH